MPAFSVLKSFVLFTIACAAAQSLPNCTKADTAFCATPGTGVTDTNIILRCANATGQPQAGNCNDNLAGVPPVGVKLNARCWESSPTAGDAQCTFNCVSVTAANGTTFFPLGCKNGTTTTTSSTGSTTSTVSTGSTTSIVTTGSTTSTVTVINSWTSTNSANTATTATSSQTTASAATATGNSAALMMANGWPMLALMGGAIVF